MSGVLVCVSRFTTAGRTVSVLGQGTRARYPGIARSQLGHAGPVRQCVARYSTGPHQKSRPWTAVAGAVAGSAAIYGAYTYYKRDEKKDEGVQSTKPSGQEHSSKDERPKPGERRSDLPDFHLEEINMHKQAATKIWVTFQDGVYDITNFVKKHPGGKNVLGAAGGPVEPFFAVYKTHNKQWVLAWFETMRIGNVHPADKELLLEQSNRQTNKLNVKVDRSYPEVDDKTFRLEISLEGTNQTTSLSMSELRNKFSIQSTTAMKGCERTDKTSDPSTKRESEFTGVKLSDVLRHAGITEDTTDYIQFECLDKDASGLNFGAALPAKTVFDPDRGALLTFEMDGKELSQAHGFPLRLVIPGTRGARHVKWISKITASKIEK